MKSVVYKLEQWRKWFKYLTVFMVVIGVLLIGLTIYQKLHPMIISVYWAGCTIVFAAFTHAASKYNLKVQDMIIANSIIARANYLGCSDHHFQMLIAGIEYDQLSRIIPDTYVDEWLLKTLTGVGPTIYREIQEILFND